MTKIWKEGDFEEFYTSSLNLTRYPYAQIPFLMQADQSSNTWTWYKPDYLKTNVPMPNYPKSGEKGMRVRLS